MAAAGVGLLDDDDDDDDDDEPNEMQLIIMNIPYNDR